MTNPRIDLPSQRAKLMMEIEQPLRRKFHRENKLPVWLIGLLFFLGMLTILTWEIGELIDMQASQALMVKQAEVAEVEPLCARYRADMELLEGTAAEETINQICD